MSVDDIYEELGRSLDYEMTAAEGGWVNRVEAYALLSIAATLRAAVLLAVWWMVGAIGKPTTWSGTRQEALE